MSSFNPYQSPYGPRGQSGYVPESRRQSTWGKVSLILGLVGLLLDGGLFVFAFISADAPMESDSEEFAALAAGLLCIGSFIVNLVGVVFAIIGLVEKNRGRAFAVAGLLLNLLPLLLLTGMVVLGLYAMNEAMEAM